MFALMFRALLGRPRHQPAYAVAMPEAPPDYHGGGGGHYRGGHGGGGRDPLRTALAFILVAAAAGTGFIGFQMWNNPGHTVSQLTAPVVKEAQKVMPKVVHEVDLGPVLLAKAQALNPGSEQPFQQDIYNRDGLGTNVGGKLYGHSADYHAEGIVLVQSDGSLVNLEFDDQAHHLTLTYPIPTVSTATIDAVKSHIIDSACGGVQKVGAFFHATNCKPTQADQHAAWLNAQDGFKQKAGNSPLVIGPAEDAIRHQVAALPEAILQHFWPDATITVNFVPATQLKPQQSAPPITATLPPGEQSYTPPTAVSSSGAISTTTDSTPLPMTAVTLPPDPSPSVGSHGISNP